MPRAGILDKQGSEVQNAKDEISDLCVFVDSVVPRVAFNSRARLAENLIELVQYGYPVVQLAFANCPCCDIR